MAAPLVADAITQAGAEGYNDIAFSGGEPILYGDLRLLLEHAKSLGMATSLTSNGILLKGERLARLEGVTDLLAISLDGVPESHNRMRNAPLAFERMRANLDGMRKTGIPFGFIFTLTQHNLHELRMGVTGLRGRTGGIAPADPPARRGRTRDDRAPGAATR